MPSPPVTSHIPQSPDVILYLPPHVVLQRHRTQLAGHVIYLLVGKISNARGFVDVEACHELFADFGADAVEGAEGAVDEGAFEEVDAEDEDLQDISVGIR